jgi:flagellar basal-body rod modification protein FlgD
MPSPIGNTYTPPAYQEKPTTSSSLDKNGFLKMLTEQIKNQDPQSSQDPSQYFNTISQMTMVEQMTNLAAESSRASAQGLLGRTVTYMDKTGQTITGTVDAVDLTNSSAPRLTVGGVDGIDPAVLQKVS